MANRFYEPGAGRAAKVHDLFSAIAPRYDLINDLQSFGLHRWWKHRLIRLARVQPADRTLDLCCGTADIALRLARSGASVIGLDFSFPMLALGKDRADAAKHAVSFVRGDALHLPFRESAFQVVTISYGLRNLTDFEAGLREMLRVTEVGGRLLVLDFGKPRHPILRSAYFAYLRHWVPLFGRLFCGDSETYSYILESLQKYPAQEGVAALMKKLQCRNVRVFNLLGGVMSINCGEKQR